MSDIQDARRRVLITGGASGFGLAIARTLLSQRARVAIGDIDSKRLQEAARNLDNADDLLPLELDVTSPLSVKSVVVACQETFGGLDTLINSAGVIHFAPLADISEEDWDRVVDVDLKGPFLCSQAAAPLICESGRRGRIVNIGSDAAKIGCPMILSYCAAKFGVIGLTKALAAELAPYGVTVNCVCPVGVSTTGMGQTVVDWKIGATGQNTVEILSETAAGIPLKRNATVADVVNAVMFFLSDESAFLTGVALDVDGGLLSTMPIPGAKE